MKLFTYIGWITLISMVWMNGFMLGAVDRIIKGTSRVEFNTHFIMTFIGIMIGIIFINLLKDSKYKQEKKK